MTDNPFGSNPFETVFKDLMKVMSSQGQLALSVAEQLAMPLAAGEGGDVNPDPQVRMRLEPLAELAQRELGTDSLIADGVESGPRTIEVVSPAEFARRTLTELAPLIQRAEQMSRQMPAPPTLPGGESLEVAGIPLSQMAGMMGPMMTGLNAGSCIGHLAKEVLGTYDIALPRDKKQIQVVLANVSSFAGEWSLDLDAVVLWLALNQLSMQALINLPHIAKKVRSMIEEHFAAAAQTGEALASKLSELDPSDPSTLEKLSSDPYALIGIELSAAQEANLRESRSYFAVISGIADFVTSRAARKLMGNFEPITEALRRRRLETREGEDLFRKLFGIGLDAATYELGHRFIFGLVERNAEETLAKVIADERAFPTPNEVEAPGLWLARLESLT
ncbi:MAG: zinc-dependent metalloprotease [Actinomycetota bacterium]|nr:zinc-dependent metalloprotease [Actinomycetota bacterium]